MTNEKIQIKFVKSWSIEEIADLYKAGGWWKETWNSANINSIIKNSLVFAIAIDKNSNRTIGMGRVISDGVSDGYIHDLVVIPECRNLGVGKLIVKKLVDYCISKGLLWIGLISEPGNEGFFSSLNFKIMEKHTPMLYNLEE